MDLVIKPNNVKPKYSDCHITSNNFTYDLWCLPEHELIQLRIDLRTMINQITNRILELEE